MPMSHEDRFFGGQPGDAEKTRRNMQRTYGSKAKGDRVFFGTLEKRKAKASRARRKKR
jgi:hypothetical protein